MKFKGLPLLAIAVALLVVSPAAIAEPSSSEHLSLPAAREAARTVAKDFARGNPSVNRVKLGACRRQAADRVECQAVGRGSTSTRRTTCHLQIKVAVSNEIRGRLISAKCDKERLALLRARRAEAAMRLWARSATGEDVLVGILGRVSRVELTGLAQWSRPSTKAPTEEFCFIEMRARLTKEDEVKVRSIRSGCEAPHPIPV